MTEIRIAHDFAELQSMIPEPELEVDHAQHPLAKGRVPGMEFRARTLATAGIYHHFARRGRAPQIYVPGSRHGADAVSLSDAGSQLLHELDVPQAYVHGEDWTAQYSKRGGKVRGVYNSGNEVMVASRALEALRREEADPAHVAHGGLVAICSSSQIPRLSRHYQAYGHGEEVVFFPVDVAEDFHGGTKAVIEKTLTAYTRINPTWERGLLPAVLRRLRLPKDGGIMSQAK